MKHRTTDEAKADVQRAPAKYDDDAGGGNAFATEVLRLISFIEANPQGFSRARGAAKSGQFDYLLYHEVLATEVVTIAIPHAKRKSSAWRKRIPRVGGPARFDHPTGAYFATIAFAVFNPSTAALTIPPA